MKSRVRILGKKSIMMWLVVAALVVSGAGAAAGTILAGKVSGEIPVAVSQAILAGNPACACALVDLQTGGNGSAETSTDEAYLGNQSYLISSGAGGAGNYGRAVVTENLALSGISTISLQYLMNSTTQTDISAWPVYEEEGQTYSDSDAYMSPYIVLAIDTDGDGSADHWVVSQPFARDPDAPYTPIWEVLDLNSNAQLSGGFNPTELLWHDELFSDDGGTGGAGAWPAGYEPLSYFQSTLYPSATVIQVKVAIGDWAITEDQSAYIDSLTINGFDYMTLCDLLGTDVPQGTQRLFFCPNRYAGVHADDQTGFQFAAEIAIGDLYLIAVPLKNASQNELTAELTLNVPDCLEVEVMTADQVHGTGNTTEAVRIGLNTWKFTLPADAEKERMADNIYIAVQADDFCAPGYYTIYGTIKQISY